MPVFFNPITRQRDIIEVLIRHGWDYMRQLLTLGKSDEPEIPAPEILCKILTDLGPVYIKLGQLLSTRPDLLPASYIEALSNLQSNVPPVKWADIEVEIRQELKQPLEEAFAQMNEVAIAAGSIAQIHRATLKNGQPVAVKIQRPGIDITVDRDISMFKQIAALLSTTKFGKRYNIVSLAEEFSTSLLNELDFTLEATYTDQLRHNLSQGKWFDPTQIVVPQVYPELSSKKILVLEWLEGKPFLQAKLEGKNYGGDVKAERRAFTTLLFRAFLQQYLADGFFHADPHPGNLFYLEDGRVGILDCGMMGVLDSRTQSLMVELVLAIIDADPERCAQITLQLAKPMDMSQPINLLSLQTDYDRLLRRYLNVSLSNLNVGEAFGAILEAARLNNLKLPSNIGLLTKSMVNLEGTGREFDPSVNVVEEITPLMSDLFQRQLIGKDPARSLLRTVLEFKELSLESPRQIGFLLNRLSSETLRINLNIQDFNAMRRTMDDAANRRSFSTVVGSLIIGAAILSTGQQTPQVHLVGNIFFGAASLLGLWLIFTILRSGRLK
ncbi:MAG: AarF/ABC1/UbiB kinase family protein [Timaviella obliquedivisa GSE-PSE-MK23-08B]|jgi:predicted unusual protein kinase regulating ubiquinone biosynthesis (AarF/ABC1/UbiB family)|nr:AarF/ABC1/UbiB kinase family protein [Timaviella obliquedivisa GSE-PSE-MK23-08B]